MSLHSDIIRFTHPESTEILRSHLLHPSVDVSVIFMLASQDDSVISILEDHLLETIG